MDGGHQGEGPQGGLLRKDPHQGEANALGPHLPRQVLKEWGKKPLPWPLFFLVQNSMPQILQLKCIHNSSRSRHILDDLTASLMYDPNLMTYTILRRNNRKKIA